MIDDYNCAAMSGMPRSNNHASYKIYVSDSQIYKGITGLFTLEYIPAGASIIQYTGKEKKQDPNLAALMKHKVQEVCERQYIFTFEKDREVDAVDTGGIMRFANHAHFQSNEEHELIGYCN